MAPVIDGGSDSNLEGSAAGPDVSNGDGGPDGSVTVPDARTSEGGPDGSVMAPDASIRIRLTRPCRRRS